MSTEMNTLQELINKRAEAKLDAEIDRMVKFVRDSRILDFSRMGTPKDMPMLRIANESGAGYQTQSIRSIIGVRSSDHCKRLHSAWLPVYIKEETELFLKEFTELQERVAEIGQQADNLEDSKANRSDLPLY